jgi:hypothetical protein
MRKYKKVIHVIWLKEMVQVVSDLSIKSFYNQIISRTHGQGIKPIGVIHSSKKMKCDQMMNDIYYYMWTWPNAKGWKIYLNGNQSYIKGIVPIQDSPFLVCPFI